MSYEQYREKLINDVSEKFKNLSLETPFSEICQILLTKTSKTESITDKESELLIELWLSLEGLFKRSGHQELSRLIEIDSDHKRLNQIETLMDLYSEKIKKVKLDDNIVDDEERTQKIISIRDLCQRKTVIKERKRE